MEVDNFIDIHPRRIMTRIELEEILLKIEKYERILKCNAGVAIVQNMQLGGSYEIVSEKEADDKLAKPGKSERYERFYSRSYFEGLRSKLT